MNTAAEISIYLDHAATTPVDPQVVEVIQTASISFSSNPSSLHSSGREAARAADQARTQIASAIGASSPGEIVFTASGSEADNLALIGSARANQQRGRHLITSCIEHHAVLHTCHHLESVGYEVTYLPVDEYGLVSPEKLSEAIRPDTILVSIMHSNNEIGTIQPIPELSRIAHDHGVLFHSDAVQSVGQIPVNIVDLGVDLLSVSAHKFYGPKGIGALYVSDGVDVLPLVYGGGQEAGRRAGTENVPGIMGMAKALNLSLERLPKESDRLRNLRDHLLSRLCSEFTDSKLNGHPTLRLPNNLNLSFKDIEAEALLLLLNQQGIEASMGSACNSESIEPSHVIRALGVPPGWERGALRLSLGKSTTEEDINLAAEKIIQIVRNLQHQV